jgi:sugar phosphate isomerase/epimerase
MAKLNIHPRVSINQISSYKWTLEQDLEYFAQAGVEVIDVGLFKFRDRVREGVELIKRAGLRSVCLSAGGASLIDSGAQALDSLREAIDAAAELNCPSLYTVSGPTPPRMTTDEAYKRLVDCLGPSVAYARDKGVRLGIEHTSVVTRSHGFIHSLADGAALSRDTGAGICLELQNCWYERHLERLFRENADRLIIVQVSDFKVGEDLKLNRRVPGDGSMPLEWMIERLLDAGYTGYFDIEVLGPAIEAEGYTSAIQRSVDWLSERLMAWGV